MGGKRNRARKYLYICIAGIIIMSLKGCAVLTEMKARGESREYLVKAQILLDHEDYEGSLIENRKIISIQDNAFLGDESLFNIGLIYAHYGYPKRNYEKSRDHFKRLVKVFPQSPFAEQAKVWIWFLQEYERLKRDAEELNKLVKKSQQEQEKLKRETEELNILFRKSRQEQERLNKEIEELSKTIKKSKQVDIEIDEKKKELSK